jgi:hypothetical protein
MVEEKPFSIEEILVGKRGTKSSIIDPVKFTKVSEYVEEHPYRIGVFGPTDTGKTHFCLTVLKWLAEKGFKPEQVKMVYVDADGKGLIPLVKKKLVPAEWMDCIEYINCPTDAEHTSFELAASGVQQGIYLLMEHEKQGNPKICCWIVLDGESRTWSSAADWYTRTVHQKSLPEKMVETREEAVTRTGKPYAPVLVQREEYGAINPLYDMLLLHLLRDCGFNIIATSLGRTDKVETRRGMTDEPDKEVTVFHPGGKKDSETTYDLIVKLYKDDNGTRRGELWKSRLTTRRFRNAQDLDFPGFIDRLEKIMEKEGTVIPELGQVEELPTPPELKESEVIEGSRPVPPPKPPAAPTAGEKPPTPAKPKEEEEVKKKERKRTKKKEVVTKPKPEPEEDLFGWVKEAAGGEPDG